MAKIIVSTENLPYAEWLEYRRHGIGGSDAAVLCGISRYKSTFELWLDKTGQLPEQEAGEPAYWGTLLEPVVRNEFQKRTGIEVTTPKQLLQSEEHPFMLLPLEEFLESIASKPESQELLSYLIDEHKCRERVSCYSYEVQGIREFEPTIHLSRIDWEKEKRGERTLEGDIKRDIKEKNKKLREKEEEKMRRRERPIPIPYNL